MLVASKHGGRLIRLELYKNKKAIFHDKAKSKSKLLGGGGGGGWTALRNSDLFV